MEHLAILSKAGILSRIISGEKTIESRWYKSRKTPYMKISPNDTVYFKETGEKVVAKAKVEKVLFFDNLDNAKIDELIDRYGGQICMNKSSAKNLYGKKFCTLIYVRDVQLVRPFAINKKGYGISTAWITLKDIGLIRKKEN